MPEKVFLNIYDLDGTAKLNSVIGKLGTGAFHGAVEVGSAEWSYGYCEKGAGVFSSPPKGCDMCIYRESVDMGETNMSQEEVAKLIEQLKEEWPGCEYDLLRRNCCVFSSEMCQRLGVGPAPGWVTNLAAAGATLQDGVLKAATTAQRGAIIAAAKANEFDEKYNIKGTCEAKAKEFVKAAQGLDQQYHIKENVEKFGKSAASTAKAKAQELLTKAQDLDKQYHIQDKAKEALGKASKGVQGILENMSKK